MERRCPNCNEPVPSNSLTCPSCYKAIPRGDVYEIHEDEYRIHDEKDGRKKSGTVTFILALIGVFGIMGLGQMYLGKYRKGAIFLLIGLPMMLLLAFMVMSIGGLSTGMTIFAIGATILILIPYVLLFIFQLIDATASQRLSSIFRAS